MTRQFEAEQFTVERPTRFDAAGMLELHREGLFQELVARGVPKLEVFSSLPVMPSLRSYRAALAEQLRDPAVVLRVARNSGGLLLGMGEARMAQSDAGENLLEGLYVPTAHGRGVGSALLDDIEKVLSGSNRAPIALTVFSDNLPATTFYGHRGFRDVPGSKQRDDRGFETRKMIKHQGEAV